MANNNPSRLGKGLGALLGGEDLSELRKPVGYINKAVVTAEVKPQDTSDVLRIPVDLIEPNPYQPRMTFDSEAMQELCESIRTFGLIQPITVRRRGEKYQIISGERRYRASIMAGMDMVPAYIRDASEQGMLEMAIVENIQRENLDPIEVAMSYQRLMEECRLTQEQMADRVGKKRASASSQTSRQGTARFKGGPSERGPRQGAAGSGRPCHPGNAVRPHCEKRPFRSSAGRQN